MPQVPDKVRIKGIIDFLTEQKEKQSWKEATSSQKLMKICSAVRDERRETRPVAIWSRAPVQERGDR
eukprot:11582762-Heterocapsa_arctica.AAC.1